MVRAADCRSAGPWFTSGCALFAWGAGLLLPLRRALAGALAGSLPGSCSAGPLPGLRQASAGSLAWSLAWSLACSLARPPTGPLLADLRRASAWSPGSWRGSCRVSPGLLPGPRQALAGSPPGLCRASASPLAWFFPPWAFERRICRLRLCFSWPFGGRFLGRCGPSSVVFTALWFLGLFQG